MQNNKRRILVLMLCILFVGSMMGNVIAAEKKRSVSIVTDVGGVNDRSFNQSAWEGLQKVQKELQIETGYLESEQQADYMLNLQRLTDQKKDLIFGVGFMMADAIEESALQNPDQKYAMIDHTYNEIPENVAAITFKEEEGSFLAGYIAGKMSKTNKVGFIGGMDIPIVNKFGYGYKAGAKYANPNIEIIEEYAGSFADIEKGKTIAEGMYQNGVDIIFHAAGAGGFGIIESAKQNDKYVIGIDMDQNYLAPDHVITSVVKRIDNAVFHTVKDLKDGNFTGGTNVILGLKEGGIDLAKTTKQHVPAEILKEVETVKKDIVEGKIKVPYDKETNTASVDKPIDSNQSIIQLLYKLFRGK